MSEEDTLIQQELVEEIMKASEQFPNAILYMETVMESYEELEQEKQQLKKALLDIQNILVTKQKVKGLTNQLLNIQEQSCLDIVNKTLEGKYEYES